MLRFGMSEYIAVYEKQFIDNLKRYAAMKKQIKQRVEKVLQNPYANTELLADANGKLNLIGCRSIRIDRNFRAIFVVCEECIEIPTSEYCFCDDLNSQTIIFLTVAPHDKAYNLR